MNKPFTPPQNVKEVLERVNRPKTAVVTGGMPYANGPLHLGHLAGAIVPPDIMARYMRMLIGKDNVLFVSGNDDHGSTSEASAVKAGKGVREFIDEIHAKQLETVTRYGISYDIFSGTSQPDCYPTHAETSQEFMRKMWKNGLLEKKTTNQWYDPKINRFLQDRNVTGKCPNPNCTNESAYSDNCEVCGMEYDPSQLLNPRSALSGATPELKPTAHLWMDMTKVQDQLVEWLKSKQNKWRKGVINQVMDTVLPAFQFDNVHEPIYKEMKANLPKHKSRYAPGKKVVVQFENKEDFINGMNMMSVQEIPVEVMDGWAHRSITRDVVWGIPVPEEIDPEMKGKTLYVWPDSLIAPISFSKVALKNKGKGPDEWKRFWTESDSRVFQFLGQDNVYFYVLMQGAMWFGTQADPNRQPVPGEYQLTDIFSVFHLMVDGEKMSKSRGNFYSADQLTNEMGFDPDQVRYFLSTLGIAEKPSNFEFETFKERNKFLAGPMNAAIEKPISAVHSRFDGKVPDGKLLEKAEKETMKIVQLYLKNMEKGEHLTLLGQIENYARLINSFFVQYKPHDDRADLEGRKDGLYTSFYILKNLMIMLYPFAPQTMERVRQSLNLPETVWSVDELGTGIPAGHVIGQKGSYFPGVEGLEVD
ncbi:methionine--tRNA ligase [Peredibacter sp. HCB2-198]|uniref:methionine--tRNA ligase n=1 Tax=Peredibacter sp. HCB2-198 TaxID=3383025 RepID=UPI0038B42FD5